MQKTRNKPRPLPVRGGRAIVDQRCRCGHLMSRHERDESRGEAFGLILDRYARCECKGCPCDRFEFKEFIFEEAS